MTEFSPIPIALLHWIAGLVILAEGANKLHRTDPCAPGLTKRQRLVALTKVAAWVCLILAGAGAVARPFVQAGLQAHGSLLVVDRVSLVDVLGLGGFALLIVRSRFKEHV